MSYPLLITPLEREKPLWWPVSPPLVRAEHQGLWLGCSLAWPLWDRGERQCEDMAGDNLHGAFGSHQTISDWVTTDYGPALRFAGNANDVVTVADPPGDPLDNTSQLSIEILFRFNTLSARAGIVGKYQAATGARSWLLYYEPTTLRFQVSSDGAAFEAQNSSGFTWTTGTWYHTIVTFNAGTWTLDVNGASVSTDGNFSTETSIYAGTKELHVGQRWGSSTYTDPLYGDIASLRIWKRVLDAAEKELLYREPWGMYQRGSGLPIPAADHGTEATPAGPWYTWADIAAGVESTVITGLSNGVSYDVRAITIDTTGNQSAGSTPETETPVAEPAVFRGVRSALTSRPNPPPHWRLIP